MDQLKRLRKAKGLSQAKLAALADVDPSTVNQIERGAREASPATLRKLADALDASIAELLEDTAPKGVRRSPYEPSFENELEEERRAAWDAAARNARQLREHGEDRMEALLSSWRDSRDHRALRGMGPLLNEAEAAKNALMDNLEAGLAAGDREAANLIAAGAKSVPNSGWEEFIAADRFYRSLFDMVLKARLRVRRERKPDGEVYEVEEAA